MILDDRENVRELTPADLRGILKYVPQWRGHTFVIAIDGAVFENDQLSNLMIELAVLRNLGIHIVVVYGIGAQLRQFLNEGEREISDISGNEIIDSETLELAIKASSKIGHMIEKGLTQHGLKCVRSNAIRAMESGIIKGKDTLFSGKVDRIDTEMIRHIMEKEWVPILSPIAFTKDAQELRLNSDSLASDLAIALGASKLIFLLPYEGLTYSGKLRLNADVAEVSEILTTTPQVIDDIVRSKAHFAIKTIEGGTPRAHIIDSRIHDGLLMEIFSKVGIGSMIHSNPYSMFRPAKKKDVSAILSLTKSAVREESLRPRTRANIEASIQDYFVYVIDDSVIGCFRLSSFENSSTVEIGSIFVHAAYKGRKIGSSMVSFGVEKARKAGKKRIVALTTQAVRFFDEICQFNAGSTDVLPEPLNDTYKESKRNSRIFYKDLD